MKSIVVYVVCQYCLDELHITDPYPRFSFRIDARSDIDAFLKYCTCPNCGKKQMKLDTPSLW